MIRIVGDILHPGQTLLNELIDRRTDVRRWTIITPRQWGKTTFLLNKALEFCINYPGANLWYVTPYYKTGDEIFKKKLLPMLGPPDGQVLKHVDKTTKQLTFKTSGADSFFKFESAENYEGLRGATLTHLICDEFAYFRPQAYERALMPMLSVAGIKELFVSTPFGKNFFYDFYQRGVKGGDDYKPGWASFRGNARMTGNAKYIEFLESERGLHPPDIYAQEYEAKFIDSGGAVFKNIDRIMASDMQQAEFTARNFAGIDLGQENDRTVLVVLNERGEVARLRRFEVREQQDQVHLVEELSREINQIPNVECYVEKNFNPSFPQFLRQKNPKLKSRIKAWTTTAKNKPVIVSDLIAAIDRSELKIPKGIDANLVKELQEFTFKHSGQSIKYGAPNGGHDDCVMALAFAHQALMKWQRKGDYIFTI